MNGYSDTDTDMIDFTLGDDLDRRAMRGFVSVTAFTLFLTGILATPVWIFVLSVASIYFAMSALIGAGAMDLLVSRGQPAAAVVAIRRPERAAQRDRVGVRKQAA